MDRKLGISAGIELELNNLRETFSIFDNPKDKFLQIMDMAKCQKPFKQEDRIELNKIYGCSSQAWVVATANKDKTFSLHTDSDALIVKGLLSILEQVYNQGLTPTACLHHLQVQHLIHRPLLPISLDACCAHYGRDRI